MDKIDEVLSRGVEKVFPSKQALEKILRSGKKIKIYQGFDPSMPNLHLGNLVGILKLKQFQDLGHEIIFLIGDFTGMIGDPTDKSSIRPRLSRQQTLTNAKNWKDQAGKILRFSGKNPAKIMFNSRWLDKINFKDLIEIAANFTVQQMIERDFFQKRLKEDKPIFLHEFLYPVAQAIDSIKMDVDLEIGGNDQTFNMLCGRTLMGATKGKEKYVLTTKLLVDSKGQKVGKTAGNALFLNASANDFYGGIMSFPDEVISLAFELLTTVSLSDIRKFANPMDLKKKLAFEVVKGYFSAEAAKNAQNNFEEVFQKRNAPHNMPTFVTAEQSYNIIDLLIDCHLCVSKSEAKRLIKQKSVDLEGRTVKDLQKKILIKDGAVIRAGKKRFVKIVKNDEGH